MNLATQNARQLPLYQCHKKVWALKIAAIEQPEPDGGLVITPAEDGYAPFVVPRKFIPTHREAVPQIGWYWVQYENGYQSFSPAEAFEEGYTLISPRTVLDTRRMCPPGSEPLA